MIANPQQDAGLGTSDGWAEPGTTPAEVLAFFDTQVASIPTPFATTDRIRVGLVRVTEVEWEQGLATGESALTGARVLVEWEGPRSMGTGSVATAR